MLGHKSIIQICICTIIAVIENVYLWEYAEMKDLVFV